MNFQPENLNSASECITPYELSEIKKKVKSQLLDQLYDQTHIGVIGAIISSSILYAVVHSQLTLFTSKLLYIWYVLLLVGIVINWTLFGFYKHHKKIFSTETKLWLYLYLIILAYFGMLWGSYIIFMPKNPLYQLFIVTYLYAIAASFAQGTVNNFSACVISVCCTLLPLSIWCFDHQGLIYVLTGITTICFVAFLLKANYSSYKSLTYALETNFKNNLVTYQATHDLLTNLPNQRFLFGYFKTLTKELADNRKQLALVFYSINEINGINNNLGRQKGDLLLACVADRLKVVLEVMNTARDNDLEDKSLLIYAGENIFIILLTGYSERQEIKNSINRLNDALKTPFYLSNKEIHLTSSVGVSMYPNDGLNLENLLIHADMALNYARQSEENNTKFYTVSMDADRNSDNVSSRNQASLILINSEHNGIEALRYQARHDSLTGVANRSFLYEAFYPALERAKNKNTQLAVFYLDLDDFKKVNDSLGHEIGDKLLQYFVEQLKKSVRNGDLIARLGGDEFAILLENITEHDEVAVVANRILDYLVGSADINGNKIQISSSIGISIYPYDGNNISDLLKKADSALYQAKTSGKGVVKFFDNLNSTGKNGYTS